MPFLLPLVSKSNPILRVLLMEEFNFNYRHCLEAHCYVWRPEKALVEHDVIQSPSPVFIHIDFISQTLHHWFTHDSRRARLIREVEDPAIVLSECVDTCMFTSFDESSGYVIEKLSELQIDPCFHKPIAEKVIAWGRSVSNSAENFGPKILPLRVEITMVNFYVRERESIESTVRRRSRTEFESRNDGNYGMVPASEWSVRKLKRKRVEEREGEICSVCLEELPSGLKVTAMPCFHLFHRDCINTWLKTSHFCPVCRFEMPIA